MGLLQRPLWPGIRCTTCVVRPPSAGPMVTARCSNWTRLATSRPCTASRAGRTALPAATERSSSFLPRRRRPGIGRAYSLAVAGGTRRVTPAGSWWLCDLRLERTGKPVRLAPVLCIMRSPTGVALIAVTLSTLSGADQPAPRWIALNRAARQALEAKDYSKLRDTLAELRPLMPGNPQLLYNLAASDSHLGQMERALAELKDLANAGLIYDFNADDDFASLRGSAGFASVLRQVEQNRKPTTRAVPVSTLPERDLLPEDIAYDGKTRRFLIGSVTKCKIVTADGRVFAKSDWPVMALRVDARRRILWAATGWLAHCQQCDAADRDKSALLAFQLDSGALLKRVDSPVKGLLGDMTISRAGDLYVSEGSYGAVLRLKAGSSALERLDAPGEFASPQTPALSSDERTLYVPD